MTCWQTHLQRRTLATLAVGGLASCGDLRNSAIAATTGGVVTAVAVPCPSRPGDIVGLALEGTGAPAGTVTVFGQAFRQGAVRRGSGLEARQANGTPLRAQLDIKTRHPDGSARHGVVSLVAPALRAGEMLPVILAAGGGAAAALDFNTALAGRQAVIELQSPNNPPLRIDLLARLKSTLADRTAQPWQSGPLASQSRVSLLIPPASVGGVTSLRLVADIAVRADGTLWVDAWLRNDIAMRPGGGSVTYSLRTSLDGREVLKAENVTHDMYGGWGRLLGAATGGHPAPPPPLIRFDAGYLADTGAIHRYDTSMGVEEKFFTRMLLPMSDPAWPTPFGTRGIAPYMPMTGGRPDIGITTEAQAVWLITGDPRAAAFSIGQAEAAGTIPWHYWDLTGSSDNKGGWMDVKHWPRFWTDGRNGPPPKSPLQGYNYGKPWVVDTAHQPDLSYVPYLLTGRRAFLDHLQAQAAYVIIGVWPAVRTDNDVVVVYRRQIRGAAWSLREIDAAAWISPDDDSNIEYLRFASKANWSWLVSQIPAWTELQGEAHGWLEAPEYGYGGGSFAPWQQDYFGLVMVLAAARGNPDAITYLNWASNWFVGRFINEQKGYPWRDGVAGAFPALEVPSGARLKTWAAMGKAQLALGQSNGDTWNRGGPSGALAVLAGIISLGGPTAKDARKAVDKLAANGQSPSNSGPNLKIIPRGMYGNPANAPACSANRTPA